jgi:hypothetical protein
MIRVFSFLLGLVLFFNIHAQSTSDKTAHITNKLLSLSTNTPNSRFPLVFKSIQSEKLKEIPSAPALASLWEPNLLEGRGKIILAEFCEEKVELVHFNSSILNYSKIPSIIGTEKVFPTRKIVDNSTFDCENKKVATFLYFNETENPNFLIPDSTFAICLQYGSLNKKNIRGSLLALKKSCGENIPIAADSSFIRFCIENKVTKRRNQLDAFLLQNGVDFSIDFEWSLMQNNKLPKSISKLEPRINEAIKKIEILKNRIQRKGNFKESKIYSEPDLYIFRRQLAGNTVVLLKNDGFTLPMPPEEIYKVLVTGTESKNFIEGYDSTQFVSIYDGIKGFISPSKTDYAPGYNQDGKITNDLKLEILKKVETCDVIIAVLGNQNKIKNLEEFLKNQEEFLEFLTNTKRPVVVVCQSSSSVVLSEKIKKQETLIFMPAGGIQHGNGLADIIFGYNFPSSKLIYPIMNSRKFPSEIPDSNSTIYPLGYGIGYSILDYDSPKASLDGKNIQVNFKIFNKSQYDADEIVQYYSYENEKLTLLDFQVLKLPKESFKVCSKTLPIPNSKTKYFVGPHSGALKEIKINN